MKRIAIKQSGWEHYTGYLGMVEFKDGVSVDPVPRQLADRLSGILTMVEIDEEGNEQQAGAPARMVGGVTMKVELEPLERGKEEPKKEPQFDPANPPKIYTREELEEIASKGGIKALREVANPWGVKDRAIPSLIRELLIAQQDYLDRTSGNKNIDAPVEKVNLSDLSAPVESDEDGEAE